MNQQEKIGVAKIFEELKYPTIVEVGAYRGEDTPEFEHMINGEYMHILVEPDPRNCQFILNARPTGEHRKLVIGAVGRKNEFRKFYFSDTKGNVNGSGSLLEPTEHKVVFPDIEFNYSGMVPCYTLDTLYKKYWLTKIDLLWVDIQGAEWELIEGGREALEHTRYCFMEVEEKAMYQGQVLKPQLLEMMNTVTEWEVVEEYEYNILLRNKKFISPWGK